MRLLPNPPGIRFHPRRAGESVQNRMPGVAMNRPLFPQVRRGDIYYVDFGNQPGSVVHGMRPAMVIQNDVGNRHAPTLIVAAITTEIKKLRQPTHVLLGTQFGLPQESMLLLDQVATIDKTMLQNYIGTADAEFLRKVDRALSISVGVRPIRFSKRQWRHRKVNCSERPVIPNGT